MQGTPAAGTAAGLVPSQLSEPVASVVKNRCEDAGKNAPTVSSAAGNPRGSVPAGVQSVRQTCGGRLASPVPRKKSSPWSSAKTGLPALSKGAR